jgi:sugar phosphate isomerase/epimerase
MNLSIITDEISQDPVVAVEFAADHGIKQVAVRSVWGKNILQCGDRGIERLAGLFRRRGVTVSAIMSPLFKCPDGTGAADVVDPHFVGFPPVFREHIAAARRLPALAATLEASVVRIFTFLAPTIAPAELTPQQVSAITTAVRDWPTGLAAVENEYVCHVRTLPELERFSTVTGLPAVIDPCNHYLAAGTDGLDELTPDLVARAVDLHVKDRLDGAYVPLGDGELRWPEIFDRLHRLGYSGTVTLESHLRGDLDGLARSITALRQWVRL